MLNFSPEKLFLVGLIALIVLGPNRLPQAARTVGRFMAELRRMSTSFQDEVRGAIGEPTDTFNSVITEFRTPANVRRSVRDAISNTLTPPPAGSSRTPPAPAAAAAPEGPPGATWQPMPPTPLAAPDDPSLN
jgi:sec-independent protein translocase protein TatB